MYENTYKTFPCSNIKTTFGLVESKRKEVLREKEKKKKSSKYNNYF